MSVIAPTRVHRRLFESIATFPYLEGSASSHPAGPSFCIWRETGGSKETVVFLEEWGRGFLANYMCKGVSQPNLAPLSVLCSPQVLCRPVRYTGQTLPLRVKHTFTPRGTRDPPRGYVYRGFVSTSFEGEVEEWKPSSCSTTYAEQ